jgi:hypothetical protein
MRPLMIRITSLALFVGLAAACGETAPDSMDTSALQRIATEEAATVTVDGVVQDLDLVHNFGIPLGGRFKGAEDPMGGAFGANLENGAPDCPFEDGSYVCTRERMDELTMTRVITFFEGEEKVPAYDPATTTAISIVFDLEGQLERPLVSASVVRHEEKIVSGLSGDETERTVNGEGSSHTIRSMTFDDGAVRSMEVLASTVRDNLVIPLPDGSGERPWPTSGSVTRQVEVTVTAGDESKTMTRLVTVTFSGSSTVEVEVNGETHTLDLAEWHKTGRFTGKHGRFGKKPGS